MTPECKHPGCHELIGDDDPLAEYPPGLRENRGARVKDVLARAGEFAPDSMRAHAHLTLCRALILGQGGREAFRQLRMASIHETND